ncbi:MAG: nodulation protein NfeD [Acidobacteria bacterium]|nr:nodulation protein NfeD [Acidobacteriota bacterium]
MNAPKLAGSARLILAFILILLPLALLAAGPASEGEEGAAAEPDAGAESEKAAPVDGEAANTSDIDAETGPEVLVARIDSAIQVVVAEFMEQVTAEADLARAEALVVELSTPGGEMQAMRAVFTAFLEADTPVVVYVSPSGAQAASAGFFILLGADVAAMAPGTNTGAAHPVAGGGGDIPGAMGDKVTQDAAATARSLAARRGRDQKLAEEAVTESRSFSAEEALEAGLVDLVAPSLQSLLVELDGRVVEKRGLERTLRTRDASVRRVEMSAFQRIRSTIAHPNIAILLMSLGSIGLIFEITHPGAIFPGVVGAICLIVGLWAMSVLPINYAGLALLLLAGVLWVLEIKIPSFGMLTLAGAISFCLGAMMLFRDADPALQASLRLIVAIGITIGLLALALGRLAFKAQFRRVATGSEGLLDELGLVSSGIAVGAPGKVRLHGEIWNAEADVAVAEGDCVRVVQVDGMTLRVEPVRDA